jgi:hypothetical protein
MTVVAVVSVDYQPESSATGVAVGLRGTRIPSFTALKIESANARRLRCLARTGGKPLNYPLRVADRSRRPLLIPMRHDTLLV